MKKRLFFLFSASALIACLVYAPPVPADEETLVYSCYFAEGADTPRAEGELTVGASIALSYDGAFGKSDGASLKLTHKDGATYMSYDNCVIITFPEELPAGAVYRVKAHFYAPSAANPGKGEMTGPGVVLNGDYAGAQGEVKFPANFGTMPVDEWKTIDVTLPMQRAPLASMHFRFVINEEPKHPDVWFLDDIEVFQVGEAKEVRIPKWDLSLPSLAKAYEGLFLIGSAVEPAQVTNDEKGAAMYKTYYNVVTAGNAMKPAYLSPEPHRFSYANADALVDWAIDNKIAVHGHTLVWHSQSAPWLNEGLTRAEAKANMAEYIQNVAEHFRGKVISWDVVNEAFADSVSAGETNWRNALRKESPWYKAYANEAAGGESGADYIYDAFALARESDPEAVLYYNDFNENETGKREAIGSMVEELNEKWKTDERNTEPDRLLIEGVGMQSHFFTNGFDPQTVADAVSRFARTGARVAVTELDVVLSDYGSYRSRKDGLTESEEQLQADLYKKLFEVYVKYANVIDRVTVWGLADNMSWRATGQPLLFDAYFAPKKAFYAVMSVADETAKNGGGAGYGESGGQAAGGGGEESGGEESGNPQGDSGGAASDAGALQSGGGAGETAPLETNESGEAGNKGYIGAITAIGAIVAIGAAIFIAAKKKK